MGPGDGAREDVTEGTAAARPSPFRSFEGEEGTSPGRLPVTTRSKIPGQSALRHALHNGWDHALKVTADGRGLVGHAGAVLLRKVADQAGLAGLLSGAPKEKRTSPAPGSPHHAGQSPQPGPSPRRAGRPP